MAIIALIFIVVIRQGVSAGYAVGGDDESYKQSIFGRYKIRPGFKVDDIIITEEGKYSSSTLRDITTTMDQLKHFLSDNNVKLSLGKLVVTDACANIGGSALAFATMVKSVNAIEISEDTYKILKHNISIFDYDNIVITLANYIDIYDKIEQDIIFIDPPWGGPDYRLAKSVSLYLGEHNLNDIFIMLLNTAATCIIAKVPINYDKDAFEKKLDGKATYIYDYILNRSGKQKWMNIFIMNNINSNI